MALQPAWRYPVAKPAEPAQQAAFYRFYLLQTDDHIARRREDYFPGDAAAVAAANCIIGDFPGVEIWCGARKVVTLSRHELAHLQSLVVPRANRRAAVLIGRNKRLLEQAKAACRRTEGLAPLAAAVAARRD